MSYGGSIANPEGDYTDYSAYNSQQLGWAESEAHTDLLIAKLKEGGVKTVGLITSFGFGAAYLVPQSTWYWFGDNKLGGTFSGLTTAVRARMDVGTDPLVYFCQQAHANGLRVSAWERVGRDGGEYYDGAGGQPDWRDSLDNEWLDLSIVACRNAIVDRLQWLVENVEIDELVLDYNRRGPAHSNDTGVDRTNNIAECTDVLSRVYTLAKAARGSSFLVGVWGHFTENNAAQGRDLGAWNAAGIADSIYTGLYGQFSNTTIDADVEYHEHYLGHTSQLDSDPEYSALTKASSAAERKRVIPMWSTHDAGDPTTASLGSVFDIAENYYRSLLVHPERRHECWYGTNWIFPANLSAMPVLVFDETQSIEVQYDWSSQTDVDLEFYQQHDQTQQRYNYNGFALPYYSEDEGRADGGIMQVCLLGIGTMADTEDTESATLINGCTVTSDGSRVVSPNGDINAAIGYTSFIKNSVGYDVGDLTGQEFWILIDVTTSTANQTIRLRQGVNGWGNVDITVPTAGRHILAAGPWEHTGSTASTGYFYPDRDNGTATMTLHAAAAIFAPGQDGKVPYLFLGVKNANTENVVQTTLASTHDGTGVVTGTHAGANLDGGVVTVTTGEALSDRDELTHAGGGVLIREDASCGMSSKRAGKDRVSFKMLLSPTFGAQDTVPVNYLAYASNSFDEYVRVRLQTNPDINEPSIFLEFSQASRSQEISLAVGYLPGDELQIGVDVTQTQARLFVKNLTESTIESSGFVTHSGINFQEPLTVRFGSSPTEPRPAGADFYLRRTWVGTPASNNQPTIGGSPPSSVEEDTAYSFTPTASDVDPYDVLVFSIQNKPSWATLNTKTGQLSGTPGSQHIGAFNNIIISVTDGLSAPVSLPAFTITVTSAAQSLPEGTWDASFPQTNGAGPYDFESVEGTEKRWNILDEGWFTPAPGYGVSFTKGAGSWPTGWDVSGNELVMGANAVALASAQGLSITATTVETANAPPAFTSNPVLNASANNIYTYNVTVTDADQDSITLTAPTLPSWLSLTNVSGGTGTLTGTPGDGDAGSNAVVLQATDGINPAVQQSFNVAVSPSVVAAAAGETWLARATLPGVVRAIRFDSSSDVTRWVTGAPNAENISYQSAIKSSGNGAMRIDVLKTDGASSGQWTTWLKDTESANDGFTEGDKFYVSFRQWIDDYHTTHRFLNGGGWKQAIISRHASVMDGINQPTPYGSNQVNEIVLQNTGHRGLVQGYNRNTAGSYPPWEVSFPTACSSTDIVFQNAVDRGPQTGTPCEQARKRYGGLYSFFQTPEAVPGQPDPIGGQFNYYGDEWITYTLEIDVGQFGGNSNDTHIILRTARDGQDYDGIINRANLDLGAGPDYTGLNLLPYNTGRSPDPTRQDTFFVYDEVIVSRNPILAANVAPGWANGVASGTYNYVPGTVHLDDIDPCTTWPSPACSWSGELGIGKGHFGDWSSFIFDSDRLRLVGVACGGHEGYHASNVNSVIIHQDQPEWEQETPPTNDTISGQMPPFTSEGFIQSRHVYDHAVYVPADKTNGGRVVLVGGEAVSYLTGGGNGTAKVQSWSWQNNNQSGTWGVDPDGFFPDLPAGTGNTDNSAVYDPVNNYIWAHIKGQGLYYLDVGTKTWSSAIAGAPSAEIDEVMFIDPVRRVGFMASRRNTRDNIIDMWHLDSPHQVQLDVDIGGLGKAAFDARCNNSRMVFDERKQDLVGWNFANKNQLHILTAPSGTAESNWALWSSGTWVASTETFTGPSLPAGYAESSSDGVYSTFSYIRAPYDLFLMCYRGDMNPFVFRRN